MEEPTTHLTPKIDHSSHLATMSGRGRGRGTGGKFHGRGNNKARGGGPSGDTKKKGPCAALGEHMFTYNKKGAAYQMRNTLK